MTPALSASQPLPPLEALRDELTRRGLDGFVVPRTDRFLGEYVHESEERLRWLTGFDGSAGVTLILANTAALFVDGRYTLQARQQVDGDGFELGHLGQADTAWAPGDWLAAHLPANGKLGFDPWLHTVADVTRLTNACGRASAELTACADNPIDAIWADQPRPPSAPIIPHPDALCGINSTTKRGTINHILTATGQDAVVLTAADSVAWLFNIRGADVPFTPLALAYAIVRVDGTATIFSDSGTPSPDLATHLGHGTAIAPLDQFDAALVKLGHEKAKVRINDQSAPSAVGKILTDAGAMVICGIDPCSLPKACKNSSELTGARAAHRRDGAALVRFLAWLDEMASQGQVVNELSAADQLDEFRRAGANHRGPSFPTISGSGPNGAIVHYRVTEQSARVLQPGDVYLVDSGGQYLDGTTDVTRTMVYGALGTDKAAEWKRTCFTRVLKGHIALATARFPKGTTGSQLDALARTPLWQIGLDYEHGTGHGVGSYLSVHEGPQRISKMGNTVALKPGMIVSNEPGYYEEGAFGIRIENLMTVCEGDGGLEFETLTLAPIDRNLISSTLLTYEEKQWLNAYHERVFIELRDQISDPVRHWLRAATRPLVES